MRIIAGKWRGRRLSPLGGGDAPARLRPTADRVRESLFNMLVGGAFGGPLIGARVLDLFAGTGALGLEALSRGASWVTLVDDGRTAQNLLRRNVALLGAATETGILRRDATRLGTNPYAPHDLVFLDPPYGRGLGEKALDAARAGGWLAPDALVVFEERHPVAPAGFALLAERRHGGTCISFLSPNDDSFS